MQSWFIICINIYCYCVVISNQYSVVARIVIDIFMKKGILLSIVMDDKGYYILGNEKTQRLRDKKLIDWLKKILLILKDRLYNTCLAPCLQFCFEKTIFMKEQNCTSV